MQELFSEFSPTSASQWKEQLAKDLKGVDFNQLIWKNNNGFDIKPFYTSEDSPPGKQPLFNHADWHIGEAIFVDDEKKANQLALEALNGGVSCIHFRLDGNKNLSVLLTDILIEHIAIQFTLNKHIDVFEKQLDEIITSRNLELKTLNIVVDYDVLAHLAKHGHWLHNKDTDLNAFYKVVNLPFNTYKIAVNASLYHNAGANQVTELALIISHYNEYLSYLNNCGFNLKSLKHGIQIQVSVGSDFFVEIAKLRALRETISLINKTYEIDAPLFISCTTSHLTLAVKDAYTNLLRSTTQAMSAVIGGCDALYVTPFDELSTSENKHFSQRMARNQQLILKEESYLNKTSDIGAGSYYIESLTEQLASKAFELFKIWEMKGGFIACLASGTIQTEINTQALTLKEKAASGELVLIGVNKYINPTDKNKLPKLNSVKDTNSEKLFEPIQVIRLAEKFEMDQPVNL